MKLLDLLVSLEMRLSIILGFAIMTMILCTAAGDDTIPVPVNTDPGQNPTDTNPSNTNPTDTNPTDAGTDTGSAFGASASDADSVAPNIVMTANTGSVILTNTGTSRFDAGMLTIAKIDGNRRITVASLPLTLLINGDISQQNDQMIVYLTGVAPGDRLILTNGIGIYAECTVT